MAVSAHTNTNTPPPHITFKRIEMKGGFQGRTGPIGPPLSYLTGQPNRRVCSLAAKGAKGGPPPMICKPATDIRAANFFLLLPISPESQLPTTPGVCHGRRGSTFFSPR